MRASSSPMPTARISSTRSESVPRPRKNDGLPCTITRLPSATAGLPRTSPIGAVSCSDTSAAGSRSTRNAVPVPARAVTWASWPSTHTAPSRSTHSAILRATVRTGHGCSA
jgi:hypothetical protein